ncbi:hypothetical protein D3C86_1798790 [compost metagenome]
MGQPGIQRGHPTAALPLGDRPQVAARIQQRVDAKGADRAQGRAVDRRPVDHRDHLDLPRVDLLAQALQGLAHIRPLAVAGHDARHPWPVSAGERALEALAGEPAQHAEQDQ